jgi:hypothetical protein
MNKENSPQYKPGLSQTITHMISDGGENFFRYLKSLGLSNEPNLLVLSPSQHYYYDESDLRNVRTLVNMKKLNLVKHLDQFLHSLFRILPPDANFIGCFSDTNAHKNTGSKSEQPTGLLESFRNFLDSMTEHRMNKNEVSEILKTHGFKIVGMTEINGVTFFYSQNVRRPSERKAC